MRNILRAIILLAVMMPLVFGATGAAQDTFIEERQQQIEERKREIEEQRREQDALQRESLFAITELDVTVAQIEEVDAHLNQVNSWIAAAQTRLESVELSQTVAQKRVADARERAAELDEEIASIRGQLQDQVVQFYLDLVYEPNFLLEDGDPNRNARRQFYVEELGADAQVLIDRLRRAHDDQQASIQQAEQAQTEIVQAQVEIEETLSDLAELQEAQQKLQEEWNRKRRELEERIETEAQASLDIQNEILQNSQAIRDLEAEIAREQDRRRIAELERQRQFQLEEERRQREDRLAELREKENQGQFDNPAFFPPVPGQAGSGFGNRVHPIFGTVRFHFGLDFSGDMGDPIQAAASGTAIQVKYREGYGNTVMIDHGDGWSTLYAHLSSFSVSIGAQVNVGQTIGAIGSTGWSTGPHLHFEVRFEGVPQDPAKYL
ncbi:MAG: peptidoglycan DD-metalloendopeptidase family protein [Acidimicrobiia bacterium]|nr:peptidoglycan DD-metalloendopeptidase family protein [Acidimicrobiia bacterium]MCY4433453.1 peptidoglycan DD-metalloendopeptidase family protein [bacterium]